VTNGQVGWAVITDQAAPGAVAHAQQLIGRLRAHLACVATLPGIHQEPGLTLDGETAVPKRRPTARTHVTRPTREDKADARGGRGGVRVARSPGHCATTCPFWSRTPARTRSITYPS
jgi:hypothetical protein